MKKHYCRRCGKCRPELADGEAYCLVCLPFIELKPDELQVGVKMFEAELKKTQKLRKCRACGRKNSNYYMCDECKPAQMRETSDVFDSAPDHNAGVWTVVDGWGAEEEASV
jgi:hypothetical protein